MTKKQRHPAPDPRGRVQDVPLTRIVRDPQCQTRDEVEPGYVEGLADLVRDGVELEGRKPVVFFERRVGRFWLADGFNRHAAYQQAGSEVMPCEVFQGTLEDAEIFAHREANATHGMRLGASAIRKKIEWHLDHPRYGYFSDGQIARWCHCTQPAVALTIAARGAAGIARRTEPPEWLDPVARKEWDAITAKGNAPRLREGTDGKLLVIDATEVGQKLKAAREAAGSKPKPSPASKPQPTAPEPSKPARTSDGTPATGVPTKRGFNRGESCLGEEQLKNWADRLKQFRNAFESWTKWNHWLRVHFEEDANRPFPDFEAMFKFVEWMGKLIAQSNPDKVCPACAGAGGASGGKDCVACLGCGFMPLENHSDYEAANRSRRG